MSLVSATASMTSRYWTLDFSVWLVLITEKNCCMPIKDDVGFLVFCTEDLRNKSENSLECTISMVVFWLHLERDFA